MAEVTTQNAALKNELTTVANKPRENIAADIAQKYANTVAQSQMAWSLIHTPTSEKVYQQFVPNVYRAADGKLHRILENGGDRLPAFILVEKQIEPALGLSSVKTA